MDSNLKWLGLGFLGALVLVALIGIIFVISSQSLKDYINVELFGGKKDCGADWTCFQQYASQCKRVYVTTSQGVEGLNATVYLETQGVADNKCQVYIKTTALPVIGGSQSASMVCSVTSADITQINRENCQGTLADLLVSLKVW